jgi:hypothetical protein
MSEGKQISLREPIMPVYGAEPKYMQLEDAMQLVKSGRFQWNVEHTSTGKDGKMEGFLRFALEVAYANIVPHKGMNTN